MNLQIYTFPFTRLPLSAVEAPGNKLMQALLRYLLPAFLDSLIADFSEWRDEELGEPGEAKEAGGSSGSSSSGGGGGGSGGDGSGTAAAT